ncbi:cytochrome c/c1 heme-lyase [Tricharina praecox]|uniref:cytochrome c/c1 heme-lyase n=1 Tax=Tricharina praecox TaxID=43433 RepID=UPI00221F8489|nr:cytochrome c/c1 heme-lyase [Tricharina praecox]KAI5854540.1 cytochrome c/c1 heme-lyase [Tricharina praecox]
MSGSKDTTITPESACPVDPAARSRWSSLLSFGGGSSSSSTSPTTPHTSPTPTAGTAAAETCPVDHTAREKWASLGKNKPTPGVLPANHPKLDSTRETSTIPRAAVTTPSNSEHVGVDPTIYGAPTGNWIYPSEEMFFAAMKRKAFDPKAADMRSIVPIHNAVNERAWKEIKEWEAGWGSDKCGGPKLASFAGDSKKMTPRARVKTLLGYHPPFDRHDWVVDRCGKKVEYVIDFYSGKPDPRQPEKVSFYLDVRPKLSIEGVKMRTAKWVGSWF